MNYELVIMNYQDSPYYNPERYLKNDCSIPPMFPHPSRNPIVRCLDWLCHLTRGFKMTPFSMLLVLIFLILAVYPIFHGIYISFFTDRFLEELGRPAPSIFGMTFWTFDVIVMLPLIIINPSMIYRHYRNKYLEKHLLPGPYGWGSLEKDPAYMYQ